jgi:hypothetical protein
MTRDYEDDLADASKKLAQLLAERERLNIEVARWQFRVAALMMLTASNEADGKMEAVEEIGMTLGGLTDAVVTAFRSAFPSSLTPTEARDRLARLGFPIEHYKNPMAAVHTVINRLSEARKIVAVKNHKGEAAFAYQKRKFGDLPVTEET